MGGARGALISGPPLVPQADPAKFEAALLALQHAANAREQWWADNHRRERSAPSVSTTKMLEAIADIRLYFPPSAPGDYKEDQISQLYSAARDYGMTLGYSVDESDGLKAKREAFARELRATRARFESFADIKESAMAHREGSDARPAAAWIALHEALHYIVYESQWADARLAPRDRNDFDSLVSSKIMEHLARGELAARGKAGLSKTSLARATEPIPPAFWVNAFMQPYGEITLANLDRDLATEKGSATCYRSIVVLREQLEHLWPHRVPADNAMTVLAKFVEPMRAKIAAEKLDE